MCLPPTYSFTPSIFGIWKVFRRYISRQRFIYVSFVVPEFSNFEWFHSSRKYHFRLLLGGILAITPLKCSQILVNFWPMMQCKLMHDIGQKKNWFSHSILEVFNLCPLTPYHLGPNLLPKLKVLWRYIIMVSFISIAFVVAKLSIFKGFCSSKNYYWSAI